MRITLLSTLIAATVLLSGCPKSDAVKETPTAGAEGSTGAGSSGVSEGGLQEGQMLNGQSDPNAQLTGMLAQRVIYFDYDQSELRADYNDLIAAHARNLVTNARQKIRLEGHSDERGSREYNIGLGERRAQTVRRALMLQGVSDDQISTVSYGEERPAVEGSDEAAWSKNRRVEIVYVN